MTMDNEYSQRGIAIINPYGGVWSPVLFQTPDAALAHLKTFWPKDYDLSKFKLAMVTQTTTIDRAPGEPQFVPLPDNQ